MGKALERRRLDPAGAKHRPDADAFGNDVEERIGRIKRAWQTTCRRAGFVGLHFRDLRREAGSRMLEGGVPEHVVQRMLGHANLATTSRHLKKTRGVMHDAMQKFVERRCTRVAHEADQPSDYRQPNPQAESPKSPQ